MRRPTKSPNASGCAPPQPKFEGRVAKSSTALCVLVAGAGFEPLSTANHGAFGAALLPPPPQPISPPLAEFLFRFPPPPTCLKRLRTSVRLQEPNGVLLAARKSSP